MIIRIIEELYAISAAVPTTSLTNDLKSVVLLYAEPTTHGPGCVRCRRRTTVTRFRNDGGFMILGRVEQESKRQLQLFA